MAKTWAARLKAAKKRGYFLDEDSVAANSWRTCAVGEKANWEMAFKSPTGESFSFSDPSVPDGDDFFGGDAITALGIQFVDAVDGGEITMAIRIHNSIQRVIRGESP